MQTIETRKGHIIAAMAMILISLLSTGPVSGLESVAPVKSGYAPVNGLNMYYEIHGSGTPLVLIHGGLCTIEACFGKLIPPLAKTRQVIAMELQAHGHTADIDRPLTYGQMASDVVSLLRQLRIGQADFLGYSIGSGVALEVTVRHPELVRKLVLAAPSYNKNGFYPEVYANIEKLKPEDFAGSRWLEAYKKAAPNPGQWPGLVNKIRQISREFVGWPAEALQSIKAPALVMIGDADVVRPEHAVELFRLLGGGVPGDLVGLPRSQLAVLPGTMHVTLVDRADWLVSMIEAFLNAPMPEATSKGERIFRPDRTSDGQSSPN